MADVTKLALNTISEIQNKDNTGYNYDEVAHSK